MASARIAVVDDHEGLRRAVVRLLQASGHEASAFGSAEEFLASAEHCHFCCLILDVRLPGLSGFELRGRLAGEGMAAPVIYVSAHDDPAARRRASREGAPFFLKPFDGQTLLAAVGAAIRES
jgi:FixJ family two-component response regulator